MTQLILSSLLYVLVWKNPRLYWLKFGPLVVKIILIWQTMGVCNKSLLGTLKFLWNPVVGRLYVIKRLTANIVSQSIILKLRQLGNHNNINLLSLATNTPINCLCPKTGCHPQVSNLKDLSCGKKTRKNDGRSKNKAFYYYIRGFLKYVVSYQQFFLTRTIILSMFLKYIFLY